MPAETASRPIARCFFRRVIAPAWAGDTHLKVALEAVTESPKLIVIEKPLCDLNFKELEPLIRPHIHPPVLVGEELSA